jgi:ribosomal protein S18 acetylase RimI-like enzyme
MIRPATHSDLPQIVKVHEAAFTGFLMTELGPRFLKAYYQQVLDHSHPLFLVWQGNEMIEGFVAGFIHPHEFYRRLRQNRWRFAWLAGTHLLLRPSRWRRVLASLRRTTQIALDAPQKPLAELASLAVHPQSQGKGIGKALVLAFLAEAQARGVHEVYLTTDAHHNDSVNAFYQRLGFQLSRQFWHTPQRLMNEYSYVLEAQHVVKSGD